MLSLKPSRSSLSSFLSAWSPPSQSPLFPSTHPFRVWGQGSGDEGLGSGFWGLLSWVFGVPVQDLPARVQGHGPRVQGPLYCCRPFLSVRTCADPFCTHVIPLTTPLNTRVCTLPYTLQHTRVCPLPHRSAHACALPRHAPRVHVGVLEVRDGRAARRRLNQRHSTALSVHFVPALSLISP
eukprot:404089-Rhodomonas_salina.1